MDSVVQKFRGALNGFNRRDVMQYMETLAAEHKREVDALRRELEKSDREREVLESTLAGMEDEKGSVAAEQTRVRSALEQSTADLAEARGKLSKSEYELNVARMELEQLYARVEELEPLAASFRDLKDRVATVELDAHRKAQATVEEAQAQAQEIRAQADAWLKDALGRYDDIRNAVSDMLRSAENLSRLKEHLDHADEVAATLRGE